MGLNDVDLNDPDVFAYSDYHAVLKELRHNDPVHWSVGKYEWGFWSVTKYEDCLSVYRHPETFCSSRGVALPANPKEAERSAEEFGSGLMLIMTDPPRHVAVRQVLKKWFTPLAVGRMEARFREIAVELIDVVAPKGACDLVVDLASRMPTAVICEMMGVPKADWDYMISLGNRTVGATDPEYHGDSTVVESGRRAQGEIVTYFARMVPERRRNPGTDLVSALAVGEVEGQKLDDREVLFNCFLLLIGGLETTRNAISGGILELSRQPEQKAMLLNDPKLMTSAGEEILRWTSPITHMMRTATRDTALRGREIRKGQKVALWNASANRDEDIYTEPYRFDVKRSPNYHLAFGYGEHFCIGANLARLELRVMVQEILRRLPDLELAGEPQPLRSHVVAGIKHMPVRFTPNAGSHASDSN